ncbi:uncharacterized protein TrAtP1_006536 [Trichoderma atroviride]|uniref:uncharacterized protein n=1 Tax=Hypocrea atroviridis TaxID=63577 RepID=UPI003325AE69|nr:hypothetical protein TrAtP1_006536 [Trichoderma atroviride]
MDQRRRVPAMVDGPDNKGRFAGELLISADAPDVSCLSGVAKPNGRREPAGVRAKAKGLMDREIIDSSNPGQSSPTGSMGCQSGRSGRIASNSAGGSIDYAGTCAGLDRYWPCATAASS